MFLKDFSKQKDSMFFFFKANQICVSTANH